jgi:hypothetical protein
MSSKSEKIMPTEASVQNFQSRASRDQAENRKNLVNLFKATPIPTEQLLVNFPLYTRSSVIGKMLYVNELYEHIIRTPGVIMEFGVWWGANMALFESLRAVHEPYNYTRKVVGFDTFEGYPSLHEQDGNHELAALGAYSVTENYTDYLSKVMDYHQTENVMSQVKKYELIKGDATLSLATYLKDHPETIISLAYFDMQLYEPTKKCLELIRPHLTKGSVIAMDELNSWEFPGETVAFREVIGLDTYRLVRSRFLPDRTYLIIE